MRTIDLCGTGQRRERTSDFSVLGAAERLERPLSSLGLKLRAEHMEEPRFTIPHQLNSAQVLFRFAFRLVLLGTFATFGAQGFRTAFAGLLTLSAIYCAIVGTMRREAFFVPGLTHWDEAATYLVIAGMVSKLGSFIAHL
jgi:hypothetical protein